MKQIASKLLLLALVVILTLGAGLALRALRGRPLTYYTDGESIRRDAEDAPIRDVLWTPPRALGTIRSVAEEHEAHVSADGLTLLLVRGAAGRDTDLYVALRTGRGWSAPTPLLDVNSEADELGPALAADGKTLFFASNRAGGQGGYDLWRARRGANGWSAPENLGALVNSPDDEYGPCLGPDGGRVYFSSNRARPGEPTAVDNTHDRDYDLWSAPLTEAGASAAAPLAELNSPFSEGAPAFSPAGDFIYFASNRPGGHGRFDLYRARRLPDRFGAVTNLDPPVNSAADELDPTVLLDGFGVIYSANRGEIGGDFDLYFTTSREVFREREARTTDWGSLLGWLLSMLPWVLLVLLALLLLPLLAKSVRLGLNHLRPLGVLARCVIASMVLHAAMVMMLMIWAVASDAPFALPSADGTRVSLVSPATGRGVVAQITGGLMNVTEIEAPPLPDTSRRANDVAQDEPLPVTPLEPGRRAFVLTRTARVPATLDARAPASPPPAPDLEVDADAPRPSVTAPTVPAVREPEPALVAMATARRPAVPPRAEADATQTPRRGPPAALPPTPAPAMEAGADGLRARVRASDARGHTTVVPIGVTPPRAPDVEPAVLMPVETARAGESEAPVPRAQVQAGRAESRPPAGSEPRERLARVQPAAAPAVDRRPTEAAASPAAARAPGAPLPPRSAVAPAHRDVEVAPVLPARAVRALVQGADATAVPMPSAGRGTRFEATTDLTVTTQTTMGRVEPIHRVPTDAASLVTVAAGVTTGDRIAPPAAAEGPRVGPSAVAVRLAVDDERPAHREGETSATAPVVVLATAGRAASPLAQPAAPAGVEVRPGSALSPAVARDVTAATIRDGAAPTAPAGPGSSAPGGASAKSMTRVTPAAPRLAAAPPTPAAEEQPTGGFEPARPALAAATPAPRGAPARNARLRPAGAPPPATRLPRSVRSDRDATARPRALPAPSRVVATAVPPPPIDARPLPGGAVPPGRASVESPGTPTRAPASARQSPTTASAGLASAAAIAPEPTRRPGTETRVDVPPRDRTAPLAWRELARPRRAAVALPAPLALDAPSVAHARIDRAEAAPPHAAALPRSTRTGRPGLPAPATDAAARFSVETLAQPATARSPGPPGPRLTDAPLRDLARANPARRPARGLPVMPIELQLRLDDRPNPYAHRAPPRRRELVDSMGGSRETERAVAIGLEWLARHQGEEGRWDSRHFDDACGECAGPARLKVDIAVTGLSVLCFLAADHTHLADGPYRDVVDRGLRWLLEQQAPGGDFIQDESMYSHGITTIVLAEAHGMTGDPALVAPVESAVEFITAARNRGIGGWRYAAGQEGDSSVLGWQVMALISARRAGIGAPERALDVGRNWLSLVSNTTAPGLYSYRPRRAHSPGMTAECMFVQQLLGAEPASAHFEESARYLLEHMPNWDEYQSSYYWYYATLALFQHGGQAWETWNEAVKSLLLEHQVTSGAAAGSWDPDDMWAQVGGRVYQTALCTLTLEVYYRYLPLYVTKSAGNSAATSKQREHATR